MTWSLLHKLLALFLGIFFLAAGILTYFAYVTSRDAMQLEFSIRGRTLAKAIASESRRYYQRADVEGFTTLLQALGETEGVLAVLAYRDSRDLWVETSIIELAPHELPMPLVSGEGDRVSVLANGMRVSEFISPVHRAAAFPHADPPGSPAGWIRVLMDSRELEKRLDQMVIRTALVGSNIILLGAVLFTYWLRRSLNVIGPLTHATHRVARGDLHATVPIAGEDELGELARCFNTMTEQLLKTTVSKNYVDNIIRSLIDALIVIAPDGTIRLANQSAYRLLGYEEDELVGHPIARVFAPDQNPLTSDAYQRLITNGALDQLDSRYVTKSGQTIPVVLSMVVMRTEEGAIQGIACVAKDVTDIRQAHERLRLQGAALESAANAVAIIDRSGTITWVNPSFQALTGYAPSEAIGHTMRIQKSGRHDHAFYQAMWDTILAGGVWHGELINRRKDGSHYTEEETITPVLDPQGRATHFIAIKQDVTPRKQADEGLKQANRKLAELDHMRTQFFSDISHELRTPLTVIRGEAEVTLRGQDKPLAEYKKALERIVSLTDQLNKLVSDLLFLARSESGTLEISKQPILLTDILRDVRQEAQVLATRMDMVATLSILSDPMHIHGDPHRLRQLLMILIDNAVNYSKRGGAVEILALKQGDCATITITDNGLGIPAADLPHVFERFYRVKRRQHPTLHPGAGLGLPIAKWIVEAHQGTISIASIVNEGTTVTVQLPLAQASSDHPRWQEPRQAASPEQPSRGQS